MLIAENISCIKDGRKILDSVSCVFLPGKLNLIMGPNGSGKSTLLSIMAAILKPSSGVIRYGKENISSVQPNRLAQQRAFLSQSNEIPFDLQVHEMVMLGRTPHYQLVPGVKDKEIVQETMLQFDVLHMAERYYNTLSGGEKQRVLFARVFAQLADGHHGGMKYLLLDEPLTHLDIHHQIEFMRLLKERTAPDLVMVAVLHELSIALKYADEVLLLKEGRKVISGNCEQALNSRSIAETFNVNVRISENGMMWT